jgi:hypothetical protein
MCCGSCDPCISDEAHKEEKERRLHTQLRLQQIMIIEAQPENAAMQVPSRRRGSSADYGGPFFSIAEIVRAKEDNTRTLTRPPSAVLPPAYGT